MSYSPSIRLEPFTPADIPELLSWVPDAHFLLQFSGPTYQFDLFTVQLESDIRRMERTGNNLMFRAVDNEHGKSVGHIQFTKVDRTHRSAWIGRVLVGESTVRGKGLGSAMMKAMLDMAFNDLDLIEVGLAVYDFNLAAMRCYQQLGFREYEREMVYQSKVGETWTTIRMKLLRSAYTDSG